MVIIKCSGNDASYHMRGFQRINFLLEHSQNIAMGSVRFKCCAWFSFWAIHYCKTEPLDSSPRCEAPSVMQFAAHTSH